MKIHCIITVPCILGIIMQSAKFCSNQQMQPYFENNENRDSMEIVNHNDSIINVYEKHVKKSAVDFMNAYKAANGIITDSKLLKKHHSEKINLERMEDTKNLVNQLGLKYKLVKDNDSIEHCIIQKTPISSAQPYVVAPKGVLF